MTPSLILLTTVFLALISALVLSAIAKSQGYRQDERDYREPPSAEV